MKKALLLIISLFIAQASLAYETVLIDFPKDEGWHSVYYGVQDNEAILQYVPAGQTAKNWTRSIVFHSYKNNGNPDNNDSASTFMNTTTAQMESQNSSQPYRYIKYSDEDSIATRCVVKNAYTPTQCDIYRASISYEGLISMDYINKNVSDFKANYDMWYQIIQGIRIYYSYYRTDRILDKATSFEI